VSLLLSLLVLLPLLLSLVLLLPVLLPVLVLVYRVGVSSGSLCFSPAETIGGSQQKGRTGGVRFVVFVFVVVVIVIVISSGDRPAIAASIVVIVVFFVGRQRRQRVQGRVLGIVELVLHVPSIERPVSPQQDVPRAESTQWKIQVPQAAFSVVPRIVVVVVVVVRVVAGILDLVVIATIDIVGVRVVFRVRLLLFIRWLLAGTKAVAAAPNK